ncbi:uncharacterized protein TNCV_3440781 [Trichonephila clavipes]|uniref:Uncharacterized protein n=1 Tax=Trichonephila clavipes TaxID=2585209 RepID=A0A8X7BEC3_TRICX|nr:uncharacterized protein TNCV_3440781 [Trichonephila clavipes]
MKEDIEDFSCELGNGGYRLHFLDEMSRALMLLASKDRTFEKMEQVREQQERLARLHFELNTQQEIYGPQSEDGRRVGRENLGKLIENVCFIRVL